MDAAWIAKRPHLKPLLDKMQTLLEFADAMVEQGRGGNGNAVDYGGFEEQVSARTAEVEAAVHQVALTSLDINEPFVRVWGKDYRRLQRAERTYSTMAGPVTVMRTLYREVGQRNGPSLDVVGQRAGVVDRRWLPRTARAMAHLLAQGTSREAHTTSAELLRLPYSRSSFERVGHAVGDQFTSRRGTVEPRLIREMHLPPTVCSVSVAIDRVAVPMEEPPSAEDQRQRRVKPIQIPKAMRQELDAVRPRRKLNSRLEAKMRHLQRALGERTPPKVARNFRMAYCATLSLHDAQGKAIQTLRYGRMPPAPHSLEAVTHRQVHTLMERLRDDLQALLERRPGLQVVLLADGAPELWNLYARHLHAKALGVEPTQLVDAWHVLEYVGSAARLLEARGRQRPGLFNRWRAMLLEEDNGAEKLLQALQKCGLHTARNEQGQRPVGDAIRYIRARLPRMNYAAARKAGLPIGSGVVEATCKSLVSQRMRRAGSRWKPKTGNEVLQLRALQLSDRWDQAMRLTLKPLRKAVRPIAAPAAAHPRRRAS